MSQIESANLTKRANPSYCIRGGERVTHTTEGGGEGEVYLVMRESPTQLKEGVRVRYTW